MAKINKKYTPYLTAVFMGLSMGVMMSFVMTAINAGFADGFFLKWLKAFGGGVSIGIPTALLLSKHIQTLVQKITN
jgi:hypothetical protein